MPICTFKNLPPGVTMHIRDTEPPELEIFIPEDQVAKTFHLLCKQINDAGLLPVMRGARGDGVSVDVPADLSNAAPPSDPSAQTGDRARVRGGPSAARNALGRPGLPKPPNVASDAPPSGPSERLRYPSSSMARRAGGVRNLPD
jgi:hypothetical protein